MTKSKQISVVHPSRNRVEMFAKTMRNWLSKAYNLNEIEYIVSLDESETAKNYVGYINAIDELSKEFGCEIKVSMEANFSCVDAVNSGAKKTQGELIVINSDDFDCPQNWDEIFVMEGFLDNAKPKVFLIDDGISKDIVSLPIMNRLAYESMGYAYYPKYISMYADNDLFEFSKMMGWLENKRNIKFQHLHYTLLKSEPDEAYKRQNSSRSWEIGEFIFKYRKQNRFIEVPEDLLSHAMNKIQLPKETTDFTSHPNKKGLTKINSGGFCN
jgi:hypothetical protein